MHEVPPDDPGAQQATTLHVRRSREGDPESTAWIIARFSPVLLEQARYRLGLLPGGVQDPEDLVQEVWMIALPRLPDLPPRGGRHTPVVMRFLATTLLNRFHNLMQKQMGRRTVSLPEAGAGGPSAWALSTTGVVSRAARSEVCDVVRRAIDDLPETDREILVLRGIEQNANQTVAQLLGIRPNAVAARYQRALAKLRAALSDSVFDDLD